MSEHKAVIFDINGTLWGTSSPEKRAIKEFNLEYTDELHKRVQIAVCGTPFTDIEGYFSNFAESLGIDPNQENKDHLRKIVHSELENAAKNSPPGRNEILKQIQQSGIKIGLVSNCYPPTREVLEDQGILQYADMAFLSYEEGITKQNPEIYSRACKMLQVSPERAIMVGDNLYDDVIQSKEATKEGIGGIFIYQEKPIRTNGHDFFVVPSLNEVPKAVEDYFN